MSRKRTATRPTALLHVLCMLALVMAAFAHKPAFAAPGAPAEALIVLPDGSTPVICFGGSDGDGGGRHDTIPCEFCRIAGSAALAAPPAVLAFVTGGSADLLPLPRGRTAPAATWPPAAPPRGPPLRTV
jgi:hypothetical protein